MSKWIAWASQHPVLALLVVLSAWILVTGFMNRFTKPRTQVEWLDLMRNQPKKAGLILFWQGLGAVPNKVFAGLFAIVTGTLPEPYRSVLAALQVSQAAQGTPETSKPSQEETSSPQETP